MWQCVSTTSTNAIPVDHDSSIKALRIDSKVEASASQISIEQLSVEHHFPRLTDARAGIAAMPDREDRGLERPVCSDFRETAAECASHRHWDWNGIIERLDSLCSISCEMKSQLKCGHGV
jgi:hypothetical protein